jgi:hypothetical protein
MKSGGFENFPKKRQELPPEFKAIYESHYKINRQGETNATSLSMKLERWLHVKVAEDVQDIKNSDLATLEIGAGMLNQMPFEPNVRNYDIVEPFEELYRESSDLVRVRRIYTNINEIPDGIRYARITSVAAFEHILNLPEVVAKAVSLLETNGSMRVAIPNEGTILWKLGTLITGYEFKRLYGLNYQILMRYEHVNTANEIETVLKYFFRCVSTSVFGINKRWAFYRFIKCTGADYDKAAQYLKSLTGK